MKRIYTFFSLFVTMMAWPVLAQDIDESFVFVDEDGEIIENGSTVVRNVVDIFDESTDVIYSGISVLNQMGSDDFMKMHYHITRIDNGMYQICFPITCNSQTEVGMYETAVGQLMSDLQDIQSEWFPVADGECDVTLTLELFTKIGLFPPSYVHKAYGPTIHVKFIKGNIDEEIEGDVNGDGEVNISDINALIDMIVSDAPYEKAADVNEDGEIGISDVNSLIDMILNK